MTLLQISIPEQFDIAEQTPCRWVLRDAGGRVLRTGENFPAALPKADKVQVVAPAARVLLTSVRVPLRNRQKLLKLLPYAVEDKLMYDPDSIHVAAGARQSNDEVAVAVIEQRWMEAVMNALRQAGQRPHEMWPETLLGKIRPGAWQVVWQGQGGFARIGESAGFALDGGNEEAPPLALSLAVQEARLAGKAPGSIAVSMPDGVPAPNFALWQEHLGVEVAPGHPWDWAAQARQSAGGINLLQGEFAPAGIGTEWLPRLKPALILVGMIAALQLGGGIIDWSVLTYQQRQLRHDMEANFRKAFPEAKAVVDAPLQMRRNLAELRHAAGLADSGDFLPLLAKAAPQLAGNASIQSMQYEHGRLKLGVRLESSSAAELKGRLVAAGMMAEFDNASAQKNATVNLLLSEGRN